MRRWQVLQDDPQAGRKILYLRGNFGGRKLDEAGLTWLPAYSTVSGSLPRADVPELKGFKATETSVAPRIVRCQIEVTTGGEVGIRHNASKVPGRVLHALWIDDGPDMPFTEIKPVLAPGVHTLTFLLSGEGDPLKVELFDVPGSPAKAQPVLGR